MNLQLDGVAMPATPSVALNHPNATFDGIWYVGKPSASPPAPRYLK
jgi:hypothetical protein